MARYTDSLLVEGEHVLYRTRQHPLGRITGAKWGILMVGIAIALLLAIFIANVGGTARDLLGWLTLALLVVGAVNIIWVYLRWWAEDYAVTNRRILKVEGLFNKRAADSSLEKINDAILEQSVFGRMFDWGNLKVLTAADETRRRLRDAPPRPDIQEDDAPRQAGHRGRDGPPQSRRRSRRSTPTKSSRTSEPTPPRPPGPPRPLRRLLRRHAWRPRSRRRRSSASLPRSATRGSSRPRTSRQRRRRSSPSCSPAVRATIRGIPPIPGVLVLGLNIDPAMLVAVAIFLVVGFPVHEFSHALAAYRLGDGTAKMFGRLTLNPIVHLDPAGSLLLVASALLGGGFIIGWAKPTPVNPSMLRGGRRAEAWVAAAGPLSNLVMAGLAALALRVIVALNLIDSDASLFVANVIYVFVIINVALFIFNLIPIPPLDGSKVMFALMNPRTVWRIRPTLEQWGFLILVVVMIVPLNGISIGGRVVGPLLDGLVSVLVGF